MTDQSRRVERVEITGYNHSVLFFRFFESDGKEIIGAARSHRIYVNGQKVANKLLRRPEQIQEFLDKLEKDLPVWADIVPESVENPDFETHEGVPVVNSVFALLLWFGSDSTPPESVSHKPPVQIPKEEISVSFSSSSKIVDKFLETKTEEFYDAYCQSESTEWNIETVVTIIDEIQNVAELEIRSAPELQGKKVVLLDNKLFINGIPTRAKGQTALKNALAVGQTVYCDLHPKSFSYETKIEICNRSHFYATLAWVGPKPDVALVNEVQKICKDIKKAITVGLYYNSSGCVTGGALELLPWMKSTEHIKIWFDKENLFIHGSCMSNAEDLEPLLKQKEKVFVFMSSDPLTDSELEKVKTLSVYATGGTWHKASFVGIGRNFLYDLYFLPPERLYEIDESDGSCLLKFLEKQKMSVDTFRDIVKGVQKMDDETEGEEKKTASEYCVKVVALKKPMDYKSPTTAGFVQIESGPFTGNNVSFSSSNLFVFGHNMGKANLMDVILYGDNFKANIVQSDRSDLVVKSMWIGPPPNGSKTPQDVCLNPEFKKWLTIRDLTTSQFMSSVSGSLNRTPFFPLSESTRHSAKVASLGRNPSKKGQIVGCEWGVLKIVGKGDPLEDELAVFEKTDLFIMFVHILNGDLSYLLSEGTKVICEVRDLIGAEKSEWKKKLEFDAGGPGKIFVVPKYVATLVYIGSRPKAPEIRPPPPTFHEISGNHNLKTWLEKRRISVALFLKIIRGDVPPKPLTSVEDFGGTSWTPSAYPVAKSGPSVSSVVIEHQPPVETTSYVQQTLLQAQSLLHRVMECSSAEDPRVNDVIRNRDELEMANFLVKTFEASIKSFNHRSVVPQNPLLRHEAILPRESIYHPYDRPVPLMGLNQGRPVRPFRGGGQFRGFPQTKRPSDVPSPFARRMRRS